MHTIAFAPVASARFTVPFNPELDALVEIPRALLVAIDVSLTDAPTFAVGLLFNRSPQADVVPKESP